MIDVPARVKDALRSGDYRKEYELKVFRHKEDFVYETNQTIFRESEQSTNFVGNTDLGITVAGDRYRIRIHKDSLWTEDPNFNQMILQWNYDGAGYYYPGYALHDEEGAYYEIIAPTPIRQATITIKGVNRRMDSNWIQIDLYHYKEFDFEEITLNNSYLVSESVKFDERMCSDTELKFGLCEGTSFEFQYFNHINISGCHLEVTLKAQYRDENNSLAWYSIPMGQYDVDECSRQASTGIIKAIAYNKLKSRYLDKDVRNEIEDIVDAGGSSGVLLYDILSDLLSGFGISEITEIPLGAACLSDTPPTIYCVAFSDVTINEDWQGQVIGYSRMLGHRQAVYYTRLTMKLPSQYTSDKYYRILFHLQKFKQLIQTMLQQTFFQNIPAIWVGPNNNVESGDTTCGTTIDAYIRGNYAYSAYLSGYLDLAFTNNTHQYFRSYPSGESYNLGLLTDIATGSISASGYEGIGIDLYFPFYYERINIQNDSLSKDATMHYQVSTISDEMIRAFYMTLVDIRDSLNYDNPPPYEVSYAQNATEINTQKLYSDDLSGNEAITLRDLQSAVFEINCQYGKLDRITDLFSGIELNNSLLVPQEDLYPNINLFPLGTAEAGFPAMYSKLWADEGNVRTFRYLIITYKAMEDGQEVEKKLQRTVNTNGTDNYNMSDNWLFRNLVWTAEQVGAYADAMVEKMRNISWFPFEMWCAGLPYLEAGDAIEIAMKEGTYKSYVLRRNLNGIQNLQDEMINGTLDIF